MESAALGESVKIVHVYDCVWHGVSFLLVAFTSDASDELWPSPKKVPDSDPTNVYWVPTKFQAFYFDFDTVYSI